MGICLPARILQVNPPPLFSSHILSCSCPDIIIFFIIIVVLHYLRIEPQVQVCFSWSFFFKDFEDHKFSSAEGASGGSCDVIWGLCPGEITQFMSTVSWTNLWSSHGVAQFMITENTFFNLLLFQLDSSFHPLVWLQNSFACRQKYLGHFFTGHLHQVFLGINVCKVQRQWETLRV